MSGDAKKPGLYANIHAKQERIAHGSGEHMRKPHSEGAPSDEAFDKAARTAKPDTHGHGASHGHAKAGAKKKGA